MSTKKSRGKGSRTPTPKGNVKDNTELSTAVAEAINQFETVKKGRPTEEKAVPIKLKPSHMVELINLIPKDNFALMDLRYQLLRMVSRHGTDEQRTKIIL